MRLSTDNTNNRFGVSTRAGIDFTVSVGRIWFVSLRARVQLAGTVILVANLEVSRLAFAILLQQDPVLD